MHMENDIKLNFSSVLIKPKRSTLSSRADVSLEREFKFRYFEKKLTVVPIVASNMDTVGTFQLAKKFEKMNLMTCLMKFYGIDDLVENLPRFRNVFYTMGITEKDTEKFRIVKERLLKEKNYVLEKICIDVANGYSQKFIDFVKKFREENSECLLMVGNVCTSEITEELVLSGADIVKIGIGSGNVCTTRNVAGVGIPQLSAIMECSDAAHGLGGHICSDGGIREIADFSKAFCAGADFVMAGSIFAGHDENNGEIVTVYEPGPFSLENDFENLKNLSVTDLFEKIYQKKKYMKIYGMSSYEAMKKYYDFIGDYRASEGRVVYVPYKGSIEDTLKEILGGIRSCMTYIGAKKLKEMPKRATFVMIDRF